jgi:1-acyl-sn-glycerol-3-phosphate acyltransferase
MSSGLFQESGLRILRNWISVAIRIYFRKIRVIGREKIPRNGPVLLAPNHQFAFMDALILTKIDRKIPFFLVRADIFKTKIANYLLRSLRMLPVYRARDKVDLMEKNEEIFDQCVDILGKEGHMIIFPEGNHSKIRRIRPVQKGILRIAFRTINEKPDSKDLIIIPVGINYDDQSSFQSDILVNFGNPIRVSQYLKEFNESSAKIYGELKEKIYSELTKLTINIDNLESYKFYENILKVYTPHFMNERGESYENLLDRFNAYKVIIGGLNKFKIESEEEFRDFSAKCNKFFKRQSRQELNPVYISGRFGSGMGRIHSYLALIVILPIYYYGVLNHILALAIPHIIGQYVVKDDHFRSSVKLAVGFISFPFAYILNGFIFFILTHRFDWLLYYFISLVFSGIFAKMSQSYVKRFWEKFKFWTIKYTDPIDYVKIKKNYREIRRKLDKRFNSSSEISVISPLINPS